MKPISNLKILHVTPVYEPAYIYGGPTRSIPLLCKALVNEGVQLSVFTTDANGPTRLDVPNNAPIVRDGITVWYCRRDFKGSYLYSRQLGRVCSENAGKFDIVHSSGVWNYGMVAAAIPCRKQSIPHIVSPRNALTKWAYDFKPVRKRLYMRVAGELRRLNEAKALHYTTEQERIDSAHLNLAPPTYIVPNPVDIEQFSIVPSTGYLRQKLGLASTDFILGMVGRLHYKKGYDLAIQALSQLQDQFPMLHLVLVGPDEGNYLDTIKQLAQTWRVESRVHWVGQLEGEALKAAYADLDSFLLPSRSESFGNVVVEAMAGGLPVLISDQVGVAPDVAKANAGIVFTLTVGGIVEAIKEVVTKPELATILGNNGKSMVKGRYSARAVAIAMIEVYREVLARQNKS